MNAATMFDLNAGLFMEVRRAVGGEESRHYLTGVLVEPIPEGGAWLVATDGHIMLVGKDASAVAPCSLIVRLDLLRDPESNGLECECGLTVKEELVSDWTDLRLCFDMPEEEPRSGVAHAIAGGRGWRDPIGIVTAVADPSKYPAWRQVWADPDGAKRRHGSESKTSGDSYGWHGQLLARLVGPRPFRLVQAAEGAPAIVLFHDDPDLVGLFTSYRFVSSGLALASELRAAAGRVSPPHKPTK